MKGFFYLCVLLLGLNFLEVNTYPELGSFMLNSVGDTWSDCTKSGAHGKIKSIVIKPNPPKRGEDLSIKADGTVDEDVSSGVITGTIRVGPFPYQQQYGLCEALKEVNGTCPLKKGPFSLAYTTKIDEATPKGKYAGTAVAADQNGEQIFCIKIDINIA